MTGFFNHVAIYRRTKDLPAALRAAVPEVFGVSLFLLISAQLMSSVSVAQVGTQIPALPGSVSVEGSSQTVTRSLSSALPGDVIVRGYPLTPGTQTPYRALGLLTPEQESQLRESKNTNEFCQVYRPEEVVVDGRRVSRFRVPDPKFLNCLVLWKRIDQDIARSPQLRAVFGDRGSLPPAQRWFPPERTWRVLSANTQWTPAIELEWQAFLRALGKALENRQCNSIDTCLISNANILPNKADDEHPYEIHYSDCADFPLYLRAYFSFKKGLPFSFVLTVDANPLPEPTQVPGQVPGQVSPALQQPLNAMGDIDMRYTREGNFPTRRLNVPHAGGSPRIVDQLLRTLQDHISTATFRMSTVNPEFTQVLPDFYSPAITKESIRPGTVLYDSSGHVGIVYEVTPNGEVFTLDAHPDNSMSRKTIGRDFRRSKPSHGAGFKNWRPWQLVDLRTDPRDPNVVQAGRFVWTPDSEIADFSMEQYFGTEPLPSGDWRKAVYRDGGRDLSFVDFVRSRLANGVFTISPVAEIRRELNAICSGLQDRVNAVQLAVDGGLHQREHPGEYPRNIFGASGEWESFSTPGRDLRLRNRTISLGEMAKDFVLKWLSKDPVLDYRGRNLKQDFLAAYHQVNSTCRISYKRSSGDTVTLSMGAALARLPRLSFDPYFCPEFRWGATTQAELATCDSRQGDKGDWYELTQFLRNRLERDPTEVHGFTLEQLRTQQRVEQNLLQQWSRDQYSILEMFHAL